MLISAQKRFVEKGPDMPNANGRKRHLTYFKGWFTYTVSAGILVFLLSTGIAQKLLFWNQSVFVSTVLMAGVMIFYLRRTLERGGRVSLEKDTLDFVRKKMSEYENAGSRDHAQLIFETDWFFEKHNAPEFADTFVADYFRNLGKRIRVIKTLTGSGQKEFVDTDELKFCFYAGLERIIKPMVNAGRKLLLFGFLGTVVGILLIGIGMRFGETAQQTLLIAKELIAGLGVAALTTILGIVGNLILSSFYEQHEDVRDRIMGELSRITSVYGLDLHSPPEPKKEPSDE